MKKFYLLAFLSVFIFLSCSRPISLEHQFKNYTWNRFDTLIFSIEGMKSEKPRNIKITFAYQEIFPTPDLPIMVTLISPLGEERTIEKRIWLKSLDGRPKGNYVNNHFVLENVLWYEVLLREKGAYRLFVESLHPKYEVNGLISIKIDIGKGALPVPKPQPGNFH